MIYWTIYRMEIKYNFSRKHENDFREHPRSTNDLLISILSSWNSIERRQILDHDRNQIRISMQTLST